MDNYIELDILSICYCGPLSISKGATLHLSALTAIILFHHSMADTAPSPTRFAGNKFD